MQRVCRTCVSYRKRKGPSQPAGTGAAPKRQSRQGEVGEGEVRAGGKSAKVTKLTSTGDANCKARVADNCKLLTIRENAKAFEFLKTMNGSAVAQKFGIVESIRQHEEVFKATKEKGRRGQVASPLRS